MLHTGSGSSVFEDRSTSLENALIVLAAGSCYRLKRLGVQHDDGTVFEANPVARGPGPQLLVDAFPGHADHLADFLLRDGNGAAARCKLVFFGKPDERTGEPARQILKNDLFDLVPCPAHPPAKQLD